MERILPLPRALTAIEKIYAKVVVDLGLSTQWEFAAFLHSSIGPLIELRSLGQDDGADPSQDVLRFAGNGKLVVHHNHLSQESLSLADWLGLARIFDQTWAHCADGSVYYGRVLDPCRVERILRSTSGPEARASAELCKILISAGHPNAVDLADMFRKETLNRAMLSLGIVDYGYLWGSASVVPYVRVGGHAPLGPVGSLGPPISTEIDQAATNLAPTL